MKQPFENKMEPAPANKQDAPFCVRLTPFQRQALKRIAASSNTTPHRLVKMVISRFLTKASQA